MKKIVLSALLLSTLVIAEESTDELVTHTEMGYVNTQGNSSTTALSLDAKATKGFDKHIFELSFDGQYNTDTNVETKNKYFTELSYDYDVTERLSYGYLIGFKEDKFSGYDYQFYTGPGAKYKVIKTPLHKLTVEGNILYSRDKIADTSFDAFGNEISYPNPSNLAVARTINGKTEAYAAYRAKALYQWKILDNLKFTQELSYRSEFLNMSNFFVFSKTAFTNKITDILSAGVSYKVDYVNVPSDGKERGDRTLTANLIVDF
jgi:putative salt-induced outer membrane protein